MVARPAPDTSPLSDRSAWHSDIARLASGTVESCCGVGPPPEALEGAPKERPRSRRPFVRRSVLSARAEADRLFTADSCRSAALTNAPHQLFLLGSLAAHPVPDQSQAPARMPPDE